MHAEAAMRKYLFLKWRCQFRPIGETAICWMIDAERALSTLKPREQEILMGRALGFTALEIAKELHCSYKAIENAAPRAVKKMRLAFLVSGIAK